MDYNSVEVSQIKNQKPILSAAFDAVVVRVDDFTVIYVATGLSVD